MEQDNQPWPAAEAYHPPAPKSDARGLYKIYKVEIDGFTFRFSSLEQLERCMAIFSLESLPSTISLSENRPGEEGPDAHWLNKLPAQVKSWRYRQKVVKYLSKVREE